MEALRDLLVATEPYVEKAAPHEQLFSGEDLANFDRLVAAREKAKLALEALENEALGSSSSSHVSGDDISRGRAVRVTATDPDTGEKLAEWATLPSGEHIPSSGFVVGRRGLEHNDDESAEGGDGQTS